MATKKTTPLGPKAQLMKKSVDQLKRKAKQLKIQGYSTKKKEQLVNSIMMAEARAKRKPGTRKKKAATGTVKKVTATVTMAQKKKMPRRKPTMVKPKAKMRRPMMSRKRMPTLRDVAYAQFNDFGYKELSDAGDLLTLYSAGRLTPLARDYFSGPYGISIGFNNMSGNVFLVDEDSNVLMSDGYGQLDLFISLPYSGEEGFYDELMEIYQEVDEGDQEYLDSLK